MAILLNLVKRCRCSVGGRYNGLKPSLRKSNKVNIVYGVVFTLQVVSINVHVHYVDNPFICIA